MHLSVGLIILLPLLGAALNGLVGLFVPAYRKQEKLIGAIATLSVAVPFVLALMLFLPELGGHAEAHVVRFFPWLEAGGLTVDFAYRIDQLSLIMLLVVTGVGSLIHIYSIGYMHGDDGFWRFFAYLNLFIFAMLNLILGESLVLLFLGWEGVGLCSYLLIGFWYTDLKKSAAANKAFIVNRIGDFAFLLAMFLLFKDLGTLDIGEVIAGVNGLSQTTLNWVVFLLFIGATGKSAQIPLFVWLPDAMAGPTPVSALIHAATMVTSGLYLLARLSVLVLAAPTMMAVVAIVGALTAIMAATIAITQNDIKKVLAYSTVSQLGFMFMAAGVGAFFVAIFHVMTHAFFKACLFLGSGSVIHSMHHVEHELEHKGHLKDHGKPAGKTRLPYDGPFDAQDMRTMGGLKKYMPSTRWTFLIATLAIAGIPPLAGFFSKDEILFKAFELGNDGVGYGWVVWVIGIVTALLTAVYMTRCYVLTFEGEERWPAADEVHPHESPATMTIPLWVLAGLSIVGGFLGLPAVFGEDANWIHHWLGEPYGGPVAELEAVHHVSHGVEWFLLALGALIAVAGVALGWRLWTKRGPEGDDSVRGLLRGMYTGAQNLWYWDRAYEKTVINPTVGLAREGLAPFDKNVVDGMVNGVANRTRLLSGHLRKIQTGVVQNYAVFLVLGVVLVLALMIFG